jgi:hypothetical protein
LSRIKGGTDGKAYALSPSMLALGEWMLILSSIIIQEWVWHFAALRWVLGFCFGRTGV